MPGKSVFETLATSSSSATQIRFPYQPIQSVNVLKELPHRGECNYDTVPLAEIEKQYGFEYCNSLIFPSAYYDQCIKKDVTQIINDCNRLIGATDSKRIPESDLALYNYGGDIGAALFYVGKTPAPKGAYFGFYSGKVISMLNEGDGAYASPIGYSPDFPEFEGDSQQMNAGVSAEHYGNLTRFMLDAPTPEELEKYELSAGLTPNDIRMATLAPCAYNMGWMRQKTFIALDDIQPGTMLTYSYGDEYWYPFVAKGGRDRGLFGLNNKPLSSYLYRRRTVPVPTRQLEVPTSYVLIEANTLKMAYAQQQPLGLHTLDSVVLNYIYPEQYHDTLTENHYSDFPDPPLSTMTILSHADYQPSALQFLKECLDPAFVGIKRVSNRDQQDFVIDAGLKVKDQAHANRILSQCRFAGIFVKQVDNMLLLPAINDLPNRDAVARLQKRF